MEELKHNRGQQEKVKAPKVNSSIQGQQQIVFFHSYFQTGRPDCRFKFPKDFVEHTTLNEHGKAFYARPDNGRYVRKGDYLFDNQWVASYNPELLLRFDCHINVERVFATEAVKYLYKYMYKGPDRAELIVETESDKPIEHNECRNALDGR